MARLDFFVPKTRANALRQLKSFYPNDLDEFKEMKLKQLQAIIIKKRLREGI